MDILFIGKRFYTNRDALTERFGRIYQLPSHWADAGNAVDLWLIDYHRKKSAPIRDQNLKGTSTPVLSRAFIHKLFSTLIKKRPKYIVASGDCYIGLLGLFLAKLLKAEFIFDIYDKYDEFNGYRRLPFFDPLPFLIKKSSTLIFASRALAETVSHTNKIVAPNGIDASAFFPQDMNECRAVFGLPIDPTFVGYFGSMEPERGIDDLLNAIQILRKNDKHIELLLGGKKSEYLDTTQEGVRYLGNIDFNKMPQALCCCNILVLPYRNSGFLDMASSCKISEYIAAKVPIVTTRTPNMLANFPVQAEALSNSMPPPNDAKALASAIMLQLEEKVLVDQPAGMTWKEIAESTLKQILKSDPESP